MKAISITSSSSSSSISIFFLHFFSSSLRLDGEDFRGPFFEFSTAWEPRILFLFLGLGRNGNLQHLQAHTHGRVRGLYYEGRIPQNNNEHLMKHLGKA